MGKNILDYVEFSEDKAFVKNKIIPNAKNYIVCTHTSEVNPSFLALKDAQIIAELQKQGFKVVVIVKDLQIFADLKAKASTEPSRDLDINKYVKQIVAFGGCAPEFIFQSECLRRFSTLPEFKAWYTDSFLFSAEALYPIKRFKQYTFGAILTVLFLWHFANNLDKLFPELFNMPAKLYFNTTDYNEIYKILKNGNTELNLTVCALPLPPYLANKGILINPTMPELEIYNVVSIFLKNNLDKDRLKALFKICFIPNLNLVPSSFSKKKIKIERYLSLVDKSDFTKKEIREKFADDITVFFKMYFNKIKLPKKLKETKLHFSFSNPIDDLDVLKEISNPYKLKIITLADGTRSVTDIAKEAKLTLGATSNYIKSLIEVGLLVKTNKKIKRKYSDISVSFDMLQNQL